MTTELKSLESPRNRVVDQTSEFTLFPFNSEKCDSDDSSPCVRIRRDYLATQSMYFHNWFEFEDLQNQRSGTTSTSDEKEAASTSFVVTHHMASQQVLEAIAGWCYLHGVETYTPPVMPLRSSNLYQVTDEKSAAFVYDLVRRHGLGFIYSLIGTGNYFMMSSFVHLLCATVASFVRGRPLTAYAKLLDPSVIPVVPLDSSQGHHRHAEVKTIV